MSSKKELSLSDLSTIFCSPLGNLRASGSLFGSNGGFASDSLAWGDSAGFASVEGDDFPHQGITVDTGDGVVVQGCNILRQSLDERCSDEVDVGRMVILAMRVPERVW